jgi:hypothetical protein
MLHIPYQISPGLSSQDDCDGQGIQYEWGTVEAQAGCLWGSLREGGHLEDRGVDGWLILN